MTNPFAKDAARKMRKELADLEADQAKATCWSAAVGERGKRIDALRHQTRKECEAEAKAAIAEAVAAAYDDAAQICLAQCDQAGGGYSSVALATAEAGSEAIRACTPADALASLEARDKRVRDEALREAGQRLLDLNQPAHAETVFAMIDADDKDKTNDPA